LTVIGLGGEKLKRKRRCHGGHESIQNDKKIAPL
jgi:hypothetical protein